MSDWFLVLQAVRLLFLYLTASLWKRVVRDCSVPLLAGRLHLWSTHVMSEEMHHWVSQFSVS